MRVRGIRGATTVERDEAELVLAATRELLLAIVDRNEVSTEDIISIVFTVTPDVRAEYPARAARLLGWRLTPLLGAVELSVPGGLRRCIRVLMHVHTNRTLEQIKHVYLRDATGLRPDL